MRALVLTAYGRLELQDVPSPAVGPRDVLVRVMACGICGSDVHGFDGSTGRRIPPVVMGHEAAGVVEAVGPDVARVRPGARVTMDSTIYDPESYFSRRGLVNLCDERRVLGVSCADYRRDGAFAELVAVPEHVVYPLPDAMTFERAALVEPVAVTAHARRLTPLAPDDVAVVFGAGLIGLMMVQVLRPHVRRIVAVDLDRRRLELAAAVGAHETVDGGRPDLKARILEWTDGRGADVAFEAVGVESSVRAAIGSVRKGATVTLIGNLAPEVQLPLQTVVTRQLRLQGSCASAGEYPEAIDLIASGAVEVDRFVSACGALAEGPAWFARLAAREPGLMKVVLRPNA